LIKYGIACIKSYQQLLPVKGRQAVDLSDVLEFSVLLRPLALPRELREAQQINSLAKSLGKSAPIDLQCVSGACPKLAEHSPLTVNTAALLAHTDVAA
jgi:hypothetical protein